MWQRANYEEAAQKIGKDFAENRANNTVSINQLATKVARDNNLHPEGIRTMVRLANVAVFEEIFHKHAGADKMFEFEVGDPEVVISTLYQETKSAMDKVAAAPCGYDFGADYYGDLEAPVQKVAEAPVEEPASYISPLQVKQRFVQAQEKIAMEKQEHEFEWIDALEKAAKLFMVAAPSVPACVTFEKDALSILGDSIVPELTVLKEMTGRCKQAFLGGATVDSVVSAHVANPSVETRGIIQMLKTAQEARESLQRG
jgi:hypothetical protein